MPLEVRRDGEAQELDLSGEWRLQQFEDLQRQLAAVQPQRGATLRIQTTGLKALDLSCAWALREFLQRARQAGATVTFSGQPPDQLRLLDETLKEADAEAKAEGGGGPAPAPLHESLLTRIGRHVVRAGADLEDGLAFLGRVALTFLGSLRSIHRLRPISVARHVYDTGITAVPIVALIAFLISVIIAYMSAQQLRGLGADIYVVDLVTIGVLRELGVLLTSVIVAGRSGSAFAAELGSMKLNEEVDALIATGVDPFEALVLPRILGLTIALPLLTIIADVIGLAGGALLCRFLLDMPLDQYLNRAAYSISGTTFWVGLSKAPVFALLIAMAGCYRGMLVRSSARELGRLVTQAVVQAIFLVILADALFAVLFMEMHV
jgi:phospholipid/cholesterol/gamma-HCH transport system permease protein